MTPIVYDNLTKEELNFIVTNNCGGKTFDVPEFDFVGACARHDVDYYIGSTQEERLISDRKFLDKMLEITRAQSWWRRWYLYGIAYSYYWGVRWGGEIGFNFGDKRYYEDLKYEMSVADHSSDLPINYTRPELAS